MIMNIESSPQPVPETTTPPPDQVLNDPPSLRRFLNTIDNRAFGLAKDGRNEIIDHDLEVAVAALTRMIIDSKGKDPEVQKLLRQILGEFCE